MAKKPGLRPLICIGELVDYHSVIGGPVTEFGRRVLSGPELLGGHTWVVWIEGYRACVAAEACTPHGGT